MIFRALLAAFGKLPMDTRTFLVALPTAIEAVGDITNISDNPDEGTLSMSLYGSGIDGDDWWRWWFW